MKVENLSHLAPYNQMVWSRNLCKVFGIDFHFNLNFGKHGSEVNKRIHNSDTDAGIVALNFDVCRHSFCYRIHVFIGNVYCALTGICHLYLCTDGFRIRYKVCACQ